MVMAMGTIGASWALNHRMLFNLLRSPMSFFDMTPIGRIVNRFSKDIDMIDVLLPMNLRSWLQCLFSVQTLFVSFVPPTDLPDCRLFNVTGRVCMLISDDLVIYYSAWWAMQRLLSFLDLCHHVRS